MKRYTVILTDTNFRSKKPKSDEKIFNNIRAIDIISAANKALDKWGRPHAMVSMIWSNFPEQDAMDKMVDKTNVLSYNTLFN